MDLELFEKIREDLKKVGVNVFGDYLSYLAQAVGKLKATLEKASELERNTILELAHNNKFLEQYGSDKKMSVELPAHIVTILGAHRIELMINDSYKRYHAADERDEDAQIIANDKDFIEYVIKEKMK